MPRFPFSIVITLVLAGSAWASPVQQSANPDYGSACPSPATAAAQLISDGTALLQERRPGPALHCFARAATLAAEGRQGPVEARARMAFAQAAYEQGFAEPAAEAAARARALFVDAEDEESAARATRLLGSVALMQGRRAEAVEHYEAALATFTARGLARERAMTLSNLSRAVPDDRESALLEDAIALAREIGAADIEGAALHARSDRHFSAGRFDAAIADLTLAIARLETARSDGPLANAFVSLGRILRAHGRLAEAIEHYDRAGAIMKRIGDIRGLVQSINARAIALGYMGKPKESRAAYEEALALAKTTGSARLINFQQGNLAAAHAESGDHRGAIRLLEDVLPRETDPYILAYRHGGLAQNFAALDEFDRAEPHARQAVELARSSGNRDYLPTLLYRHARVLAALGRTAAALDVADEAVAEVERTRARLVPLDFMKRGFADTREFIFDLRIGLLQSQGDAGQSLVVSEQARARAFLDLLASRTDGSQPPAATAAVAASGSTIASHGAGVPATAADIASTAARLDATILSFWVSDDHTLAWVAAPGRPVRSARIPVGRSELATLVSGAIPASGTPVADHLARLHRLLIRPVQAWLPAPGEALTIVPHGPLFRLSFAALRDTRGVYLIERHPITYAPSVSTLVVTAGRVARPDDGRSAVLVVADPRPFPAAAPPLPALPASRVEAASIARILGRPRAVVLSGAEALETEIRKRAPEARVLHVATHGVIRDDEPLESFMAVGRSGDDAGADGRLTVREIYDMSLPADLVVLSACRTATGPLSGDGIAGLGRALFSAGAASVIATLWDVADEPSARLMASFYRHWNGGMDKRSALRRAQLDLIRDLRAGTIRIRTRAGVIPLQEQAFYWAGYILMGEP